MPADVSAGVPSLTQILGWDTTHLYRAATDWTSTAERWEETFDGVHRGALAPGGTAWEGAAAEAAHERTFGDLVKVRGLADALSEAAAVARRGADQLDYLKRQTVEAITDAREAGFTVGEDLSVTDTSKNGGLRIAAMRQHAGTITARAAALSAADKDIAARIGSVTTQLSEVRFAEAPETVQALDVPLAPPPDPAYPVNDVIAEATDLDGNHVVLRRGYYDAVNDKGFGWDKIYWKHGLINPNVFKDLISHVRPIENQGGSLVYEVPINKAHCTSGFLGLPSCADTGESLTMRIVANTNPSYDVPGGGQKGVITMFPLPGGSGVVEVKKNWTLTPPWVNNYAPIN
ncbi:hypothetical protein [Mycolicibacterium komossense]|uniref:ESX-1 secretion-associated protein EspA/EspE-like domain-containing protein n=1 Tax=Mycolicibacterium komossense TaxID=1779 RepID=A0ABT3CED2_9MYCO|nr:hypothetical protein [Mycolicibacterium komossense]MCV7227841.1 hypothetical protein [Mycolicibacterium komossense]